MKKVLFICTRNAARSQMAEALFRDMCGEYFESHSAGMKPSRLDTAAISAMAEVGMDISRQRSKSVFDYIRSNTKFAYVITLCNEAAGQLCPKLPGATEHVHWSFPDPAAFGGTDGERFERTRLVRDAIKQQLKCWCAEMCVHDEEIGSNAAAGQRR